MNPRILGVRHHSPACAHRVERQIRTLRPAYVLIEGPADFNERLDELYMPHCLPVAIYSYLSAGRTRRGSWTPFAAHSPEWRALVAGRKTGAKVRFIDLPAWHDAFADLENRYADTADAEAEHGTQTYHAALGKKLGVEGYDALWDRLFEDRLGSPGKEAEPDELDSSLDTYFINLRADTPGSLGNQERERMMAQWISWAMAQTSEPVVVVCGGYHAPALAQLWREMPAAQPVTPLPSVTEEDPAEIRYGSYLVPYTFKRLDAFTGYASGMPSPAYYQWLWEDGADFAGHELLSRVMRRLRDKKLPASTADMICVHTSAQALARLRGHKQPLRVDWLDAITGAMVKDALSVPLPWTYRGTLLPGTDPVLVEVMDVLAGDVTGRLAPDTPQPPLVFAVAGELETAGIHLNGSLTLDLFRPAERAKSRILHRLAILAIPGINRVSGPDLALEGEARECWQLSRPMTQLATLIEAGSWGASLEAAAGSCLEADIRASSGNIEALASALNRAAFAGLNSLSSACIDDLQNGIARASRFEPVGAALSTLHTLLRHGQMLDMADAPMLAAAVEAAFDRALWLFELPGTVAPAGLAPHISGVEAIVRICADVEARRRIDACAPYLPAIEPGRARSVLRRKSGDPDAGPVSRGAALGGLLALDDDAEGSAPSPGPDLTGQALALLGNLPPAQMGDALAGMVALAREVLVRNPSFLSGLDMVIRDLDDGDFIVALPAMRGALAWLPTQERGALAEAVLRLHDAGHLSKRALTAPMLKADAESLAAAGLAEKKALARLAEWGFFL